MSVNKVLVAQLLALGLTCSGAIAQDSSDSGSAAAPAGGSGETAAPVNPVQGLFTPQPQYPTAQTQMNPDPSPPTGGAGGGNPLGALFNMGASPTAPAAAYNTPETPKGDNPLQGFFTGQPQFVTPQTLANPDPSPKMPGPYGTEAPKENTTTSENGDKNANPSGDSNTAKDEDKAAGDKDKTASDKDKPEGKDDKDKDKTASEDKDKQAKGEDKDKEAKGEDKDKDKEKTAEDGDKEKSKDKTKKAEKEEEPPAPGAYNALKEAIGLINSGQPGQAVALLSGITKQYPAHAQAHYLSAVALVTLRNYDQAAEEYRAVIRLVPTSSLAQRAADGLKKIGAAPPAVTLPPLRTTR